MSIASREKDIQQAILLTLEIMLERTKAIEKTLRSMDRRLQILEHRTSPVSPASDQSTTTSSIVRFSVLDESSLSRPSS